MPLQQCGRPIFQSDQLANEEPVVVNPVGAAKCIHNMFQSGKKKVMKWGKGYILRC